MIFEIMGKKGHQALAYEPDIAEIKFNELREANLIPMVQGQDGKFSVMRAFDKDVEKVRWLPRIAGG